MIDPHDVFAFRHNWAEPLVERLEWQTRVARTASGLEAREANRSQPRRSLTYRVGTGRTCDALVADWLAEHLGKPAWWPLPQYAARLTLAAEAGATILNTAGIDARHFGPPSAQWLLETGGVQGWQGIERLALLIGPNGWRAVRIHAIAGDTAQLADPLPGTAPAGSSLMPLLWGRTNEPVNLTQLLPGVASGSVSAQFDPAPAPDQGASVDPLLDGIPVWPDGDWSSDPGATVAASVTQHDLSPAQPWLRRDDPWTLSTLSRRYVAASSAAIDGWRARLWRAQGRLNAFWLPDGLAPVLRLTRPYQPGEGGLSVDAGQATSFWHRPAACLILLPSGQRLHALTGALAPNAGGTLMLRSPLTATVPAGSRVIRLMRCRLDHDAVDLHWHAPELIEIALTARQLPEAQSAAAIDWPRVLAPPPLVWPMVLSAPPRPHFQCPPPPPLMHRRVFRHLPDGTLPDEWVVPTGVTEIFVTGCGTGGHGGHGGLVTANLTEHAVLHQIISMASGGGGGGGGSAPITSKQAVAVTNADRLKMVVGVGFGPSQIISSSGQLLISMPPGATGFMGATRRAPAGSDGGSDEVIAAPPAAGGVPGGGTGESHSLPLRGEFIGAAGGAGGRGAPSPFVGTEYYDIGGEGGNGGSADGDPDCGWDCFSSFGRPGGAGLGVGSGGGGGGGNGVMTQDMVFTSVSATSVEVMPFPNPGSGFVTGTGGNGGPGLIIVEWEGAAE